MLIALLACIDVQSGSMLKSQPIHKPVGARPASDSGGSVDDIS
jgi:hypothetical protein